MQANIASLSSAKTVDDSGEYDIVVVEDATSENNKCMLQS